MQSKKPAFRFVAQDGSSRYFASEENQAAVDRTAAWLIAHGAGPQAAVVVCLRNCPAFAWIIWACMEHGIPLVTLNPRLSQAEQRLRLDQLEGRLAVGCMIEEVEAAQIEAVVADVLATDTDSIRESRLASAEGHSAKAPTLSALVMFTSGTTGIPKACALSAEALLASARLSNESLSCCAESCWQATLPLCHIGGMQVILRSLVADSPFILYEKFDAARVLEDARAYGASHISVVDKMLQELLACDAQSATPILPAYTCLLLGGAALNPKTLDNAKAAHARVFASFGMTETASQVANALVDEQFIGGAQLMDGFEVRILSPDEQGRGLLALKGPSLFSGYLNAQAQFTDDGFFITGDCASMREGLLFVHERTQDMFVSGGENIYPAEIERALNQVEGVAASYVFGVADDTWGRRPVAIVESGEETAVMQERLVQWATANLSRFSQPERFVIVPELPRSGIGKIDRAAARALAMR